MAELERALVAHVLGSGSGGLGEDVLSSVKTFALDTLGVGLAGRGAPLTPKIRAAAARWGEGGQAMLLGGGRAAPAAAAFVNGFQIHCQEYDCVHEEAVVHPLATILSVLLAETDSAERQVTGGAFAAALAAGVDVAAGLGIAAPSAIRFFRPATAGIFGSVMAAAKIRGFTEEQAVCALGHALSFASGTMQAHLEGKPTLPLQIANAARGAVMAADLAEEGIDAPQAPLSGPFGYLSLFEEAPRPERLLELLSTRRLITEVSHKPFPTGRAAHGGIVLMQALRGRIEDLNEVESVVLTAPPLIERLVGRRPHRAMPANHARLCFPYLGALTLLNGSVGLDDFGEASLTDERVRSLAEKIEVRSDGGSNPAAFTPQHASARLTDGRTFEVSTEKLLGSPADPLTRQQHLAKFRACVAFGAAGLRGGERTERMIEAADGLEDLADIGELTRLFGEEPTS